MTVSAAEKKKTANSKTEEDATSSNSKSNSKKTSSSGEDLVKDLEKLAIKNPIAQEIADLVMKSKNILVLTGAGISVSAGIPDFRTKGTGLYDNLEKYNLPYAEAVFDIDYYRKNPKPFVHLASEIWPSIKFQPTLTHSFIKLLDIKKKLLRNYTQNIDGLETPAGLSDKSVVACHGHFKTGRCIKCKTQVPDMEKVRNAIWKQQVPKCGDCGGLVKPDIVFFGENLPPRFHDQLPKDLKAVDCCMIIGTSLQVPPVAHIPNMVGSARRVLLNMESVDGIGNKKGDLFHAGPCDDSVREIAKLLGWGQELLNLHKSAQQEEAKGSA